MDFSVQAIDLSRFGPMRLNLKAFSSSITKKIFCLAVKPRSKNGFVEEGIPRPQMTTTQAVDLAAHLAATQHTATQTPRKHLTRLEVLTLIASSARIITIFFRILALARIKELSQDTLKI